MLGDMHVILFQNPIETIKNPLSPADTVSLCRESYWNTVRLRIFDGFDRISAKNRMHVA